MTSLRELLVVYFWFESELAVDVVERVQLLLLQHALRRCVLAQLLQWIDNLTSCSHRNQFVEAVDERVALQGLAVDVGGVERVVETTLVTESKHFSEELLGVALEDGVEGEVMQVSVLRATVVVVVDEVLDVVVRPDVLNVLQQKRNQKVKSGSRAL